MAIESPPLLTVSPGDVGLCRACQHTRTFTNEFLEEVIRKYLPVRDGTYIYLHELGKFKCSKCGAKSISLALETPLLVISLSDNALN